MCLETVLAEHEDVLHIRIGDLGVRHASRCRSVDLEAPALSASNRVLCFLAEPGFTTNSVSSRRPVRSGPAGGPFVTHPPRCQPPSPTPTPLSPAAPPESPGPG